MTTEIEDLVSNSKNCDGLARIFDHVAETIAAPRILTSEDEPEPAHKVAEARDDE